MLGKITFALAPLVALGLLAPRTSRACATVTRVDDHVTVAAEAAIVVWDAARKEEQFIRRARFEPGKAADFGFLVPTPTKPELAEAGDGIYSILDAFVEGQREIVHRERFVPGCLTLASRKMEASGGPIAASAGVTVLEEKTVAGLDATVLEASDPGALSAWLVARGYAQRPELLDWLAPYIARQFKITAFKYAKGAAEGPVFSRSVVLTFSTPQPFYPYREPSDAVGIPDRSLALYLIASERMEASLGEKAAPWGQTITFAGPAAKATPLLTALLPKVPEAPWLTVMVDRSTKRASDDVYFTAAKDRSEVKPPPVIDEQRIEIPMEVIVLVVFVAGALLWVARRRSRKEKVV